jgi:hypothetical protein
LPHTECFIDGVWLPSVTTILSAQPKPWLQVWRDKCGSLAERKTKLAGQIGDEFHRCIEQYLDTGTFAVSNGSDGFPTSCTERVTGMMKSFIDWAVNVDGVVHSTELKVISKQYTYSGTFDAIGTLNGKPMIFDWKSSARIYDDYELQLAAYAQAYNEGLHSSGMDIIHKGIKEGIIVHVSKDKPRYKLTTKTFKLGKRAFKEFLKLRQMFDDIAGKGVYDEKADITETTGC